VTRHGLIRGIGGDAYSQVMVVYIELMSTLANIESGADIQLIQLIHLIA
jgi:hypothetical protein